MKISYIAKSLALTFSLITLGVSASTTGQLTLTDSSGVVVPTYQNGENAYIQVVDSDGNADATVAETLTVKITSETEDTGTPFSATEPVGASSNVGDGTLTVLKTSYDTKTEDWTILSLGQDMAMGTSYFRVTGSVSGLQSQNYFMTDMTTGESVSYTSDNNEVSFKIENGSVAFSVGDTITFSTSAGSIVGETVTLTETDVDTGIFTSSITFNEAEIATAADGILDVQSGDLITVFYDDVSGDWGDAEQVRSTALYAATVIKGSTLLANTVWTEDNSPYLVTGDVTVSVNTTLTIMPGVKVLFLANTDDTVGGQAPYDSELIIKGSLNVAGTESKGVTLTSSNREPATGDWGGVRVENGTASLAYTTLEYSAYGVDLNEVSYGKTFTLSNSELSNNGVGIKTSSSSNNGVFNITNNIISNNSGRAIDGNSNYAKWTLSGNTIKNNGNNGDYVLHFSYSYSLSFTNNEILDNVGGIYSYGVRDDFIFTDNTLANNQDNDMMMSGGLQISTWASEGDWMTDSIIIEDNIIDDNSETGIYLQQSGNADPAINRNKVRNNSGHGIYVYSQNHNTQPSIHDNEITGNGLNGYGGYVGLYVSGKAVPSIVGNTIDNNGSGIYVNYNDVNGNGDFDLTDNIITNNQGYGISVNGYAKPVINDNDIVGNTGYALENHTSFALVAKNNWWGVDDSAEINAGTNPKALSFIYDGNTDSNAGKVNYAGWLNASYSGGGTPVSDTMTGQLTLTDTSGIVVPTYQNGESAYIQVADSDGNANAAVAETLTVKITSETEDTGTPFSATEPVGASSNVGDGTLTVLKTSYDTKTEDWTILSLGQDMAMGTSYFRVTGSVSGLQSQNYFMTDMTTGESVSYTSDNNEVSFKIENGSVAFSVGDTITFSTSAGSIVGETVTLTETDVDTGIFTSSITFNEAEIATAADGILDVQSGDLITVFYDDVSGDWGDAEQVRSTALYAATVIKGSTLLANTVWTEDNSPYLVTGDVTVSVNTTLTIMPGVKVLFLANTDDTVGGQAPYDSELIIKGSLNVAGTESKGVTLTSSNREPATGDWGGVRVENGTASLAYTTLEYSAYGVDLNEVSYGKTFTLSNSELSNNGVGIKTSSSSNNGVFNITNNIISNNSGRAIDGNSNYAKWTLSGNTIKNNGNNGDYVLHFSYSYSLSFTNNEILDNVGGIYSYGVRDDFIFTDNTLANNQDNDMMMSGGLQISTWASEGDWMTDSIIIEDNIIDDNSETGIYLQQSGNADPAINRNKVRNNSGHGIYVYSQNHNTQPSIHDNEITGNGLNGYGGYVGLYVSGKAVPSIVGNTIDNNGSGIYVNYNDVNGNGDFDLTDNIITNNQGYGISVNGYAKPVINDNDIVGNTGYALENHTSFALVAKNNWWGVDDSAEINAGTNPKALSFIYDGNTDSNAGKVNYAGWLNASYSGGGTPVSDTMTGQLTLTDTSGIVVPTYQNGESAYIQVADSDGNANAAVAETLTVKITSETEDTGTPFSATEPVGASSNVGDGTLTVLKTSYDTKTEDWTILSLGQDMAMGTSYFRVTGSVSGLQSQNYFMTDMTTGESVSYTSDNNEVSFKIENGSVAFSVGDTITFSTSAGSIVGETVTLTETDVDTGIFTSSITFNEAEIATAADGILDVQSGDLITVFYDDVSGDWGDAEQVRSTALYAATVIKGSTLLANTVWTEDNSPYLVTGDVTVSVNTTLTIMPGVKVLFLANTDDTVGGQAPYDSELIIKGSLNVAGTESKGVTLTSSNREPATGDWGGVRVENGTASLAYTTLEYSAYGVDLNEVSYGKTFTLSNSELSNNGVGIKTSSSSNNGVFNITNNIISNNSGRAIDGNSNYAKWTLSGNTIKNNGNNGDYVLHFSYSYSLSFTNNEILDNVGGIYSYGVRDDFIFTDNTLANNQDNDMMMSGGLQISTWASEGDWMTDSIIIEDNIIDDNSETGIYLQQSGNADPAINRNKVRNNSGHGIYVYSQNHNTQPSIHDNEITGNGLNGYDGYVGLYVSGKAVPSIVGNTIDNNGSGIYVNYNDVNGNGDFDLTDNIITNNQGYGISVNGYAKPVINDNDIVGNTGYALENHTSFALVAKNNWWGVDDSAEINAGTNPQALSFIYDGNNDSSAGKVNYAGWLSFSIQDQTPPVTVLSSTSVISSLSFEVTLSCNDDNGGVSSGCAATYYTIDGSDPTTSSLVYDDSITLNESTNIKFFSVDVAGHKEVATSKRFYIGDMDAQNASRNGELTLGDQDASQSFSAEITEPVILLGAPSYKDSGSGVAIVTQVTSTTVTASFKEWEYLDGIHDAESVPYVVLTAGRYLLSNGDELEVGVLQLSSMQEWQEATFESSFTAAPSVILTSQSNETNKVFNLLTDNITSSGFSAKLAEQENNTVSEYTAKVGYLAYYKNELEPIEQSEPLVVSSTLEVSSDWSVFDSLAISLQEEASFDEELVHTSEFISMININGTLLLQQVGELETDTSSIRLDILDSDQDGLVNVLDTDDDNDGVSDVDDAFPLDASESFDTDGDGIGNNGDNDDDGDGIIDDEDSAPLDGTIGDDESPVFSEITDVIYEATGTTTDVELVVPEVTDNNLNAPTIVSDYSDALALGTHEITWTATDFSGNVATATQQVHIVDTTAPQIDTAQVHTFDARGLVTDITNDIRLIAYDVVDGEIGVAISGDGILSSGKHTVAVTAQDNSGNVADAEIEIHINPQVELTQDRKIEPGAILDIPVQLSGDAAIYPVTIYYEITGVDLVVETAQMTIEESDNGALQVSIPNDAVHGEVVQLTLISADNAVLGENVNTALTVDIENYSPTMQLSIKQKNMPVSVIDARGGVVTITAIIDDLNVLDTHDITWSSSHDSLVDLNDDGVLTTFEFSPETLEEATYGLSAEVMENNTSELFTISVDVDLVVSTTLATLNAEADSDNDGISDADEGYTDTDQDGISDYLDTDDNPSRLPLAENTAPMQTTNGLRLSLGDVSRSSMSGNAANASVDFNDIAKNGGEDGTEVDNSVDNHFSPVSTIINFNVSGLLEVGITVPVVIPLAKGSSIPENAIFRKYSAARGWYDFVVDSNNAILSALADSDGNCPAPLSSKYEQGLNVGDNCIELLIQDGGENDADGLANSIIKDPGVLATEIPNQVPIISLASSLSVDEETSVDLNASETTDVEGDTLTYTWAQLSGTTVELLNQSSSIASFTSPKVSIAEILTFELTVSDGFDTVTSLINVTVNNVNAAPVVSIDSHLASFNEGISISLTSVSSDPDGDEMTYSWTQTAGPTVTLSGATTATVAFTAPQVSNDQTIELSLTVSDGNLAATTTTSITVKNVPAPTKTPKEKSSSGGGSMSWLILLTGFGLVRRKHLSRLAA